MTANQENLQSLKVDGFIWSSKYSENEESLLVDVRSDDKVDYYLIHLESLRSKKILSGVSWWSNLESYDGTIYYSQYLDKSDPTNKKFFYFLNGETNEIDERDIPKSKEEVVTPVTYMEGTAYFNEVAEFLQSQLVLACEYLEHNDKIILCYYLRLRENYARKIMVLKDGEAVYEDIQDSEMSGFASGSFFVASNKLIFVKNRNEICTYTL